MLQGAAFLVGVSCDGARSVFGTSRTIQSDHTFYQGLKSGKLNIPAGVPPPTLRTPALGDDPRRRVWGVWGAKPHQKATFLNFVARSRAFFKSDLPTYRRNTKTVNQFYPGDIPAPRTPLDPRLAGPGARGVPGFDSTGARGLQPPRQPLKHYNPVRKKCPKGACGPAIPP